LLQIEILEAEVIALKQLVLTSTPSSPNKHLHPQIDPEGHAPKKEKNLKPFWKTHRRSTSHHEFTKESRQQAEAQQQVKSDRCKEVRINTGLGLVYNKVKMVRMNTGH
jgi:Rab-3A-interacting protein